MAIATQTVNHEKIIIYHCYQNGNSWVLFAACGSFVLLVQVVIAAILVPLEEKLETIAKALLCHPQRPKAG
jgi:hypothetical protein